MALLPVIERELRAAARRKSTYRIRLWSAGAAFVTGFVALHALSPLSFRAALANPLFLVQGACAVCLCLLAGVFLSADSLSEEKRDGTLGLLFLTGLKPYEIVLGKFAAVSLNAVYGLLAVLPITAIPLLMGGTTFADVFRMALALAGALFFSLAAGLCVSAFVRESSRAMAGTLALVLAVTGLPLLALLSPLAGLAWLSPIVPFACASEAAYALDPARFWLSLLISHLLGWLLVAVTSLVLPYRWQEKPAGGGFRSAWCDESLPGRKKSARRRARKRILSHDPVRWLLGDAPRMRLVTWSVIAAWGFVVMNTWIKSSQALVYYRGANLCALLLKILLASQACRFFTEARQNGTLELLLCSPLQTADLIKAQWQALKRLFLWPMLLFFALATFLLLAPPPSAATALGPSLARTDCFGQATGASALGLLGIRLVTDSLALGWVGMGLALTMKRPNLAPAMVVLLVLVLPSVLPPFDVVADMLFISWGTTKLQQDFRLLVAERCDRRRLRFDPP